jgi:CubicO group peptidase (beta-lactamase class C family)
VFIESQMSEQKIPGLSLAVAKEGRIRYARGFGMADLEASVPASAETAYRTASIAKSMTATAVLRLMEQGKLNLDEPIQTYCPSFPEKKWKVTARQLLGHLGGVRHYRSDGESRGTAHFYSVEDALQIFKEDPLIHEPGTAYAYTTYGFNLLGCAVEGASGQYFMPFLEEVVLAPALMIQTRTDDHFALIRHRARGYMRVDPEDIDSLPDHMKNRVRAGDILNAPMHDTSMKVPGGGLVSTAVDLVRFALALNEGLLLKKETLDLMWTSLKTSLGKPTGYGMGWFLGEEDGKREVYHSGSQAGTKTLLLLNPDEGIVIAAMCNLQNANLNPIVDGIRRLVAE